MKEREEICLDKYVNSTESDTKTYNSQEQEIDAHAWAVCGEQISAKTDTERLKNAKKIKCYKR